MSCDVFKILVWFGLQKLLGKKKEKTLPSPQSVRKYFGIHQNLYPVFTLPLWILEQCVFPEMFDENISLFTFI